MSFRVSKSELLERIEKQKVRTIFVLNSQFNNMTVWKQISRSDISHMIHPVR